MKISIFDVTEDPYWWIVRSEKFFNSRRLSDAEKILESVLAYQVCTTEYSHIIVFMA
jgi:hypothetical protein